MKKAIVVLSTLLALVSCNETPISIDFTTPGKNTLDLSAVTSESSDEERTAKDGTQSTCGNITIDGGTVTATGGNTAPGIGSGNRSTCGDIVITTKDEVDLRIGIHI